MLITEQQHPELMEGQMKMPAEVDVVVAAKEVTKTGRPSASNHPILSTTTINSLLSIALLDPVCIKDHSGGTHCQFGKTATPFTSSHILQLKVIYLKKTHL
jgi:hypothetical protein